MLEKRAMLMMAYGWSEFYVKWGISGAKAWAYWAWATENEATVWGKGIQRKGDGYLAQEIKAIKERKKKCRMVK